MIHVRSLKRSAWAAELRAGAPPLGRTLLAAAGVAVATVAYRTTQFSGFENDHYMHLAWAQQVVRGAWPTRDFVDPGFPLTIALSALAQWAGGNSLLGEYVLCVALLAAAAGVTCWLAARFTSSILAGIGAAVLQIAVFPRLYNYPKILVPLVGLSIMWAYIERPTARRAALMGAWMAVGFLFRHDYLAYLAVGSALALLVVKTNRAAPPQDIPAEPVDWSPVSLPPGLASLSGVSRRKGHGLGVHAAACAGAALAVVLPYLAALAAAGQLRAHVADAVEFARGDAGQWLFGLPRLHLAAPLSLETANALLLYGAFGLPLILVGAVVAAFLRRRLSSLAIEEQQVFVLAVFALVVGIGLIRHPFEARLPDGAALTPMMLVAIVAMLSRRGLRGRLGAVAVAVVAAAAVGAHGGTWERVGSIVRQPRDGAARSAAVWGRLKETPPSLALWPGEQVPASIRYLRVCTTDGSRILVTSWAPQVFTFADRGFAGGHSYILRRTYHALDQQRKMIKWLLREQPPVALLNMEVLDGRFELLRYYLDLEYHIVGSDRFGDEPIAVAVRRRSIPAGVDAETGWPCFR